MRIRLTALLVALVLSAASPALAQKAPGVMDSEVVIGITTPLSGPAAGLTRSPGLSRHRWSSVKASWAP